MDNEDKLFLEICGAPVLVHTLAAFQKCSLVNEIIVVAHEDKYERISNLCNQYSIGKVTKIMAGGPTRLESVMNGVMAVSKKAQIIAIHDGARPCIDEDVINRAVSAAAQYHAVAPAVPVSSTLKRVKDGVVLETVDRNGLFEVQTPQVFAAGIIKAALTKALSESIGVTDDCMAAEYIRVPVHITAGSRNNIKLTTSEDIAMVEAILRNVQSADAAYWPPEADH